MSSSKAVGDFSTTTAVQSELFSLDFTYDLQPGDALTTATPVWDCTVASGVDADPQSHISEPTIFGARATCRGASFDPTVMYVLACTVTTVLGNTIQLWAYLTCEEVGC